MASESLLSCISPFLQHLRNHSLHQPKEVMFYYGVFVCLSVCPSDNWKSCERILTNFVGEVGHGPWTNDFNFGDDPDDSPDPVVQSPKSGFTGLSNYQRMLMKFYGELGCVLETNWLLHFGDDPHHYPDSGVRSGSRSGSGKNCHNSIMSTSSWLWISLRGPRSCTLAAYDFM